MAMSESRNGGSSLEGKDSEVESMGSSVLYSPQQGFMSGSQWEMVMAHLTVPMDEAY